MIFHEDDLILAEVATGKVVGRITKVDGVPIRVHMKTITDNQGYFFHDERMKDIIKNFGNISVKDFNEQYPEYII